MPQPHNSPIRIQLGLRGWSAIVAAVIALGAVTALAVGVLVFLLPVLILAPVLYWLMPKPKVRPIPGAMNINMPRPAKDAEIVEGEFTVVSAPAAESREDPPGGNN